MYASVEYNSSFLRMLLLPIGYTLFRAQMGKGSLHHVSCSFLGLHMQKSWKKIEYFVWWVVCIKWQLTNQATRVKDIRMAREMPACMFPKFCFPQISVDFLLF